MWTIQSFYKSKEWVDLLSYLKLKRTHKDGQLYCEHCGKPIIKSYDCIGHHIIELTPANINDYTISLNPDNIKLIHFKCHNEIHNRYGYAVRKAYIIYGAPCSGKAEFVHSNAGRNDIVLDINNIWQMISINQKYDKPATLKQCVFGIRDCLLDMIRMRTGKWNNAWVIGGYPLRSDRERAAEILGATLIYIDENKEVCIKRAENDEMRKYIEDYFEIFQP